MDTNARIFIFSVAIFVFVVMVSAGAYFFYRQISFESLQAKLNQNLGNENEDLIETVGKLFRLPPGETPSIATVNDVSSLKNQPFFRNAVKGDKILVFREARKAILYRPSENKIIEVSLLSPNVTPTVALDEREIPASPSAEPTTKIIFRPLTVTPTEIR